MYQSKLIKLLLKKAKKHFNNTLLTSFLKNTIYFLKGEGQNASSRVGEKLE